MLCATRTPPLTERGDAMGPDAASYAHVDLYHVLGVAPTAAGRDVSLAYTRLARAFPALLGIPDASGQAGEPSVADKERYQEIRDAYDILRLADQRSTWEVARAAWLRNHGRLDLARELERAVTSRERRGNTPPRAGQTEDLSSTNHGQASMTSEAVTITLDAQGARVVEITRNGVPLDPQLWAAESWARQLAEELQEYERQQRHEMWVRSLLRWNVGVNPYQWQHGGVLVGPSGLPLVIAPQRADATWATDIYEIDAGLVRRATGIHPKGTYVILDLHLIPFAPPAHRPTTVTTSRTTRPRSAPHARRGRPRPTSKPAAPVQKERQPPWRTEFWLVTMILLAVAFACVFLWAIGS